MQCSINGAAYTFYKSYQENDELRNQLNCLAQATFDGLSFEKWYQQGFWDGKCTPYTLFDGDLCVANVFANSFEVVVLGQTKRYIQLGTVMTHLKYRSRGLARFLMQEVYKDWNENCDQIYLYANDSVVDFYPKFGFAEAHEYQYRKAVTGKSGTIRQLDMDNGRNREILLDKLRFGNPFAAIQMPNSTEITLFHCIMFKQDAIYYLPDYDAVMVAEQEDGHLLCSDIFCKAAVGFDALLSIAANRMDIGCCEAFLGFTPLVGLACTPALLQEKDTHLFVLSDKDNIFLHHKLMLPLLSHT